MSPSYAAARQILLLVALASITACKKEPAPPATAADSMAAMLQAMQNNGPAVGEDPPADIAPAAFADVKNTCRIRGFTCKDYKIPPRMSRHMAQTAADRANGYEDKWCVEVAYVQQSRDPGHQPWSDSKEHPFVAKRGGAWVAVPSPNYVECLSLH